MNKGTFPRLEVDGTPSRTPGATASVPRWVIGLEVILGLLLLLFAISHFTGMGMGHMRMSIPQAGRIML